MAPRPRLRRRLGVGKDFGGKRAGCFTRIYSAFPTAPGNVAMGGALWLVLVLMPRVSRISRGSSRDLFRIFNHGM